MRQGRLKPSETSDGRNVKIHWDAVTKSGMALDYLCVIREGLTPYILCSAPGTDEELVGLSLAPRVPPISTAPRAINQVVGRRSHPSMKGTGTKGMDG